MPDVNGIQVWPGLDRSCFICYNNVIVNGMRFV